MKPSIRITGFTDISLGARISHTFLSWKSERILFVESEAEEWISKRFQVPLSQTL